MFPDFNIYSSPLLILVIQGLILSGLLLWSYKSKNNLPNLILGILLLITCYHRTTFTIGFMSWYDTYRNTKVNYYLIPLSLAVGPLIYFYIKSYITIGFSFTKKEIIHFVPVLIYFLFRVGVYIYDRSQSGFNETQNGVFMQSDNYYNIEVFYIAIAAAQLLLYLAFSIHAYYKYRKALVQQYSNTYKSELIWLRNFLFVYSFLFLYDVLQTLTDGFLVDLHWTQEWWYQFFSVLVVIYVGIKGYFTDMDSLKKVDLSIASSDTKKKAYPPFDKNQELQKLQDLVSAQKLYLDPNLSLTQLARAVRMSPSQVSDLINKGLGQNFNDYINKYRVEGIVKKLSDENNNHLSILAIALDNGFNSKATFNRVFKKKTGKSPSEYRK